MTFKAWIKKEKNSIGFLLFDVQLLSHVCLYVTPRSAAHQASLSFTISQNLPKCMPSESAMLSNRILSNIKNIVASEDTVTKGKTQATDSTPIKWAESPAAGQQLTGGYWAEHEHGLSCSMNPTTWWQVPRGAHPTSIPEAQLGGGSFSLEATQHPFPSILLVKSKQQSRFRVKGRQTAQPREDRKVWLPVGQGGSPTPGENTGILPAFFFPPSLWNVLSNWSKQIF